MQNYEIKKKFYKIVKNAKAYKLIYIGSKNGFLPGNFQTCCGDKGNTIIICKIRGKINDKENIIGGFTDIPWQIDLK